MNRHFTKLVKAHGRQREFNFRQLPGAGDVLYHVDVSDERGNRYMFKMQKTGDGWMIQDRGLPQWLYDAADDLGNEIER